MDTLEALKSIRRQLDHVANFLDSILNEDSKNQIQPNNYIYVSILNVKVARAFLGKQLFALGEDDPYAKASKDRLLGKSTEIPEEVHKRKGDVSSTSGSIIESIDISRLVMSEIKSDLDRVYDIINRSASNTSPKYVEWAIMKLEEARIHLGFQLGEIRDSQNG